MHQDSGRHERRLVSSPEKESSQRVYHPLSKVLGKSEEPKKRIYGEQGKNNFEKFHNPEYPPEFPYVMCKALRERGGKDVGPKVFAFTETDSLFLGRVVEIRKEN
jgi:hypothetical protein